MNFIIVRYAEIGTKGKNRGMFEKKLVENIHYYFKKNKKSYEKIYRKTGRILIKTKNKVRLDTIFGISSVSFSERTSSNIDTIKKVIKNKIRDFSKKTKFRITTQRLDKTLPFTSMEMNKIIGQFVVDNTDAKVSLEEYDTEIFIELIAKQAYIFTKKFPGPGGLPVGTQGKVYSLITESEDSFLSSVLIMKRGCSIIPVCYKDSDISKIRRTVKKLERYHNKELKLKKISNIIELKFKKIKAIVYPYGLDNITEKSGNILELYPLLGYDLKNSEIFKNENTA
ncbi:hypothetical protein GF327_09875 [Candidatus Woesearchaeota archaeon]|nr:hypothetical protein [Candidatus Woesearchaeota archaeon]